MKHIVCLFTLAIFLVGCNDSTGGGQGALMLTVTPTPEPHPDAQYYADEFDVSLEEASSRLAMQESIGELGAALEQEQSETFAGLWIQHEPEYRVIVAFTRDGEETLRPYINGKPFAHLIELRTFQYTLAELTSIQEEVTYSIVDLGVTFSSGVYVQDNAVVIEVGNKEQFMTLLAEQNIELPPSVVVRQSGPAGGSIFASVAEYEAPDGRIIRLPKQASGGVEMAALMQGSLIEENGCLRVSVPDGDSYLIIWRYDHTIKFDGDQILVLNGDGEVVGRENEPFAMGGGESTRVDPLHQLDGCPGPYWIGGGDAPP
jgi:hypothetical protein